MKISREWRDEYERERNGQKCRSLPTTTTMHSKMVATMLWSVALHCIRARGVAMRWMLRLKFVKLIKVIQWTRNKVMFPTKTVPPTSNWMCVRWISTLEKSRWLKNNSALLSEDYLTLHPFYALRALLVVNKNPVQSNDERAACSSYGTMSFRNNFVSA